MNRCRGKTALLRLGVIFVAAAVGLVTGAFAQGPENADCVDLSSGWRFKIGDDESWSSPGFDDSLTKTYWPFVCITGMARAECARGPAA